MQSTMKDNQPTITLPDLFRAEEQRISEMWETLGETVRAQLEDNLPTFQERLAFLKWNARVSQLTPEYLRPCTESYQAVKMWDILTVPQKLAVTMAAIGPISQVAKKHGFVGR